MRQPEPGAMVARADGNVRAVDMHGERNQYVGIIGVVFQAQAVRAQTGAATPSGVPGTHQVQERYRVLAQRFGQDQVGRSPARVGMPANIQRGVGMARQYSAYLIRIFNIEEWVERIVIEVIFRVAIQYSVMQWTMGKDDGLAQRVFGQCGVKKL